MAEVVPFRAWRYDQSKVALPQVVTQPYDKITPEMQQHYYDASPHNLVRIVLGKPEPTDHPGENTYTRAATFFRNCRRDGIFLPDPQQSFYQYVQRFASPAGGGGEYQRWGFVGLGRIEDYSANIVFRHEQTLAKPKADRLELLRATHTHFEQIFMLYSDPSAELEALLPRSAPPDMETRDEYGVLHQVWRVSDPGLVQQVSRKMRDKKLIIADGHHRYETTLNYRDERRAAGVNASQGQSAPHEFMMMTFVNMDAPGLLILPTHRVLHGLSPFSVDSFKAGARSFFSVEEVDPTIDPARATEILARAGHSGTALLAVTPSRAFLLDTPKATGSNVFRGLSVRQQSLDVVQLHRCLLEEVLGISEEAIRNQQNISYVRDANEALSRVRGGGADVAFLLNPVHIRQVRDIALANDVLPQKSTDFYPKLLSGLTVYALE